MILYKRNNNNKIKDGIRLSKEPYLVINTIFAGVILLVLAYSGIFSPVKDNYPVTCIHEKITGLPCVSCGLSHSFSLIVRGRIEEAYQWNIHGMRIFLFFAAQLMLRVGFSYFYVKYRDTRKQLIIVDCIGSGVMFLIAFRPFIASILLSL